MFPALFVDFVQSHLDFRNVGEARFVLVLGFEDPHDVFFDVLDFVVDQNQNTAEHFFLVVGLQPLL